MGLVLVQNINILYIRAMLESSWKFCVEMWVVYWYCAEVRTVEFLWTRTSSPCPEWSWKEVRDSGWNLGGILRSTTVASA